VRDAGDAREDFFLARSFRNLDDLNAQLQHWLDTVANPRVHATTQRRHVSRVSAAFHRPLVRRDASTSPR
jgi:hypothetical protein